MLPNAPANGHAWIPKPRQHALLEALTTFPYPSLKQACETVSVPYGTGKNWHEDSRFLGALAEMRTAKNCAIKDTLQMKIHGAGEDAVVVLLKALREDDPKEAVRVAIYLIDRILGRPGQTMDLAADGKTIQDLLYAISLPVPALTAAPMADDSDL